MTIIENLIYIASLCPYAHGEAVYRARSELMRYGIENNYNDKSNCAQLGYLRYSQSQISACKNPTEEIVIFPNPVVSELNFVSSGKISLNQVIVYDLTGRIVLSSRIPQNNKFGKLNVSLLSPGTFTIIFLGSNGLQRTSRLIVIK